MRILLVLHGFPPREIGGAELHAWTLAKAFADQGHEVFVFARTADRRKPEFTIQDETIEGISVRRIVTRHPSVGAMARPEINARVRKDFENYVKQIGPEIVHIHHLKYLTADIPALLSEMGIPYLFTLHEFWMGCGRGTLLRRNGSRCEGPEEGRACARHCPRHSMDRNLFGRFLLRLLRKYGLTPGNIPLLNRKRNRKSLPQAHPSASEEQWWRERFRIMSGALKNAAFLVSPSHALADRFTSWGIGEERFRVLPHGIAPPKFPLSTPPCNRVIGFFGSFEHHKGADVLLRAMRDLPDARVHLWGNRPDEAYIGELRRLAHPLGDRARFMGPYLPNDLDRIMGEVDIVAVPSICEESFNLVAREALVRARPVVASRIGGLSEAVEEGVNGLLVEPGDPGDLATAMRTLLEDQRFRCLKPVSYPTPAEYAQSVLNLYGKALAR